MAPTGTGGGYRDTEVAFQLRQWAAKNRSGIAFGPSRLLKKSLNEKKIYPQSLFLYGRAQALRRKALLDATRRSEGSFFADGSTHTPP
jgi:Uma2 family endonuclease